MSTKNLVKPSALQPVDPIWSAVRGEALEAVARDPLLSAFLYQCARQAPLDRDTPAQDSPQSPDGR